MANQTVSTNKNFDDASILGLLNGDTLNVDSLATLTINSDTRWAQNAAVPVAITVASATGGTVSCDGTTVWELPFAASSGNVPTLGTLNTNTVTGGTSGATGEFLAVFTGKGVNPSAAASAMPASGFVKLRTTSGTFQAGETVTLPGGATVTISNAGKRSWISVVVRNANGAVTIRRLGNGFVCTGDWYEVGTLAGTSGETLQMPTADVYGGFFVEKTPGSAATVKDYTTLDRWTLVPSAAWTAYNIAGDERGRYFTCTTAGVVTFGNGTIGKLPPAGCKVYIGNVIFGATTSADYTTLTVGSTSTTRTTINATNAIISIDKATFCGWRLVFISYFSASISNTIGVDGGALLSNGNGDSFVSHCIGGSYNIDAAAFYWSACINGNQTFQDCSCAKLVGTAFRDVPWYCDTSKNLTINRIEYHGRKPPLLNQCTNVTASGLVIINQLSITGCTNVTITGTKVCGRPIGAAKYPITSGSSTASTMVYNFAGGHDFQVGESFTAYGCTPSGYNANNTITAITATSVTVSATANPGAMTIFGSGYAVYGNAFSVDTGSTNVVIDGISFGYSLAIPYSANYVSTASNASNVRVRNIGTRTAPLDGLGMMQNILSFNSSLNCRAARCFQINTRGTYPIGFSACDDVMGYDCGAPGYASQANASLATNNCRMLRWAAGGLKAFGTTIGNIYNTSQLVGSGYLELEVSATETLIGWIGVEKTVNDPSSYSYAIIAGTPRFDGLSGLLLTSVGDTIEFTSGWVLGCTGFNAYLLNSVTNAGNHTFTYDIDKGTGFSGTYKTVTTGNLSAETGILASGFRFKLRIACSVASTTNKIIGYLVSCITDNATKDANPYPYNEPKCTLSGGISGSDLCVFNGSTGAWLTSNPTAASYAYVPWNSDFSGVFRLRRPGYQFVEVQQTVTEAGFSTAVSQSAWSTIPATDPGALSITVTNHGASPVTWNGKQWSITIQATGGETAAQIANWINYNTARDWPAVGGFRGDAWPEMVVENGATLETKRGTLFGSAGASLKGVRVIDGSGNAVSGFARQQADDGSYWSAPTYATASVTGIVVGSRLQVYNVTTNTEIVNDVAASSSWSLSYLDGTTFTSGDVIRVRVTYTSGVVAYLPYQATAVASSGGWGVLASQVADDVYNANAVDGSAVNKFTADYIHAQVDLQMSSDFSGPEMYAWWAFNLTTSQGVSDFFGGVTALDQANYRINSAVVNIMFDNLTTSNRKQSDASRIYRDDDAYPVYDPTTGGGGIDLNWRVPVYPISVGGISPSESQIKSWVRAELATEMARIDVATSTRMAAGATVDANVTQVNNIAVKGTGVVGDEWGPV